MENSKKKSRALLQLTASFLLLFIATLFTVFILNIDHDIVRFSFLSSIFLISFLFQFYILRSQILTETKRKNQLRCLLGEQDRTARMLIRRDRALSEANERLREIDRLKSEFVSVAAHQMRTPLSGIKWSLDMLAKETVGPVNVKQKRLLLKSYESNERMILLVNNLLNTDRIESGRAQLEFVRAHLKDIIDNVLYYISPQAKGKKITIDFSFEDDLPYVSVDTEKIREVMQNIIENAVKYSEEGGTIHLGLYTKEKNVVVSVKDEGIGIPKNFRGDIFTKFYRGDNAVKMKTEGSGLGLFVAKEIVERHGGEIYFESKEGAGTTFYILIPIAENLDENEE